MRKTTDPKNIYLVTNYAGYFNVYNQIKEIYPKIKQEQILIEPASLNTAPAIALAMKYLVSKEKIRRDVPVVIVPSDHSIAKIKNFTKVINAAAKKVANNIGTIGIIPTSPETGYGYIKKGLEENGYFKVLEFKEKPDKETAEKYISSGEYVWNSGMYIFNEKTFSQELKKCAPEIFGAYSKKYEEFVKNFEKLPSIAIDVAVSEKSKKVIVFEGDFIWSDIGSFDALSTLIKEKGMNQKQHILIDSDDVFVHSSNGRLIATAGVSNLNIIENNDCILISQKGKSEDVKKVVKYLQEKNYKEIDHNVIGYRPWGKYEVLIDDNNHKVKKITVYPGASLSLQSHKHRSEHWIVVRGKAAVINGDREIKLKENESTYIPATHKHRLSNPGKKDLEIIEVQTGDYFGEDDIIRYDDIYERNQKRA